MVALQLPRRLSGLMPGSNFGSSNLCFVERFSLLIQSCADLAFLKKIHAHVVTRGFSKNLFIGSKIVDRYAILGALADSRLVFQKIVNNNLALWNAAMVSYFRAGYAGQVLILYKGLKFRRIGLDEKTITFCLKSCTELNKLFLGKGMHVDALKLGLSRDKFVGSSLVGLYSKLSRIDDSQKAFEEIFNKDIIAYTSMITGYSEIVDSIAWYAFETANEMMRNNLEVNHVTLVSLLQVAGNLGAIREGKSIHGYTIRRGIGDSDEVIDTSIVGMYTRCGLYRLAAAFLKNSKGIVASWNAFLSGLARTGESSSVIQYFSVMLHEHNLIPDSVTLANVLSGCADLGYSGCAGCIHAYLLRRSMPLDTVLATALIEVYSKCARVVRSKRLFDRLMVKDVVSYNTMMYGYLQNGMTNEAIELFNHMMAERVPPNYVTVFSLLASFADGRDIVRGRWIHGFTIRRGFYSDIDIANQILHMYSNCGKYRAARFVFDSLEKKNLISWTAMMKGCISCGQGDKIVGLYKLMHQLGVKPDSVALTTAVQAASEIWHLKSIKQIHCFVYRTSLEKDKIIINSLITAYAKCGRLDLSVGLFFSLEDRDLDSWNTMISAYGMHGFYIKVLEMFNKMGEENIKPDELTFSSVLSACGHAGLIKEGLLIFQSMTSVYVIPPQKEHYGCIVDLLGRAGHLEEGYELSKISNLKDKSNIFCALLSACRTYGNAKLGHIISKELLEHNPHDPGTYALISEVYAQEGLWNESANLRVRYKEIGLKKIPGTSLIESAEDTVKLC